MEIWAKRAVHSATQYTRDAIQNMFVAIVCLFKKIVHFIMKIRCFCLFFISFQSKDFKIIFGPITF